MKKNQGHKVEIRKRGPQDRLLTGATASVWIDGVNVKYCTDFSFKVSARGLATVTITLIPSEFLLNSNTIVKIAAPKRKKK